MNTALSSHRIILDSYKLADRSDFFKLVQDVEVMKHVGGPKPADIAEKLFARFLKSDQEITSSRVWAIRSKQDLKYIGHAALFQSEICKQKTEREILFYLNKSYWKNGLAAEVSDVLLNFACESALYNRVWATIDPDHVASRRVCEKIGMNLDRIGQDAEGDFLIMKCELANRIAETQCL